MAKDRRNDLKIGEDVWISDFGGQLVEEIPLESYSSKSLPEHVWMEEDGTDVIVPQTGMVAATEVTFKIGISGKGALPVAKYRELVHTLAGKVNTFYHPLTESTYNNLVFSKTGNTDLYVCNSTGVTTLTFSLTMKMTRPYWHGDENSNQ